MNTVPFPVPCPDSGGGPSITLLQIRPNPNSAGATVAYADVQVGPVPILGISVVRSKRGGEFVAFPSRQGSSNGKWFPLVEISEPTRRQVIDTALAAYQRLKGQGSC